MKVSDKKFILIILIFSWIFLASFNVLYNSVKTISEIRQWASLADSQKREKLFGDSYYFAAFINTHTKSNAKILFYSNSAMPFFYARYYSYPRHLYWYQNSDEYVKHTYPKQFDYIALYNMHTPLKGYELEAIYSEKQSGIFGSLYKRK